MLFPRRLAALAQRLSPLFTTRGGKLKLFLGCVALLVGGALVAPRAPARVTQAPLDLPVPRLQAEIDRRDPARVFERVPVVGATVAGYVVVVPASSPPAGATSLDHARMAPARAARGYGLVVSADGDVLSHVTAIGGGFAPVVEDTTGQPLSARVTAMDPRTGLVLIRLDGVARPNAPAVSTGPPTPGDLLVAHAGVGDRLAPRPALVASVSEDEYVMSPLGGALAPGTPLFSLDREAVAVVGSDGRTAYPVPYALERLGRLVAGGTALPLTLGLALQPLTAPLAPWFGDGDGVLVADVRDDGPAARAGLRAGDVITAVGGAAVVDLESLQYLVARLAAGVPAEVALRRAGADRVVQVAPEPTLRVDGLGDMGREVAATAPTAATVFDAADLAAAGVAPDARVLAIGDRDVTTRTAPAVRRRSRAPWLVRLDHDGHRFFAIVGAGA